MKNLLFVIALIIPVTSFSQVRYYEISGGNIEKKKKDWYKRCHDKGESKKEFFAYEYKDIQELEFVLVPEMYNSTKDSNIVSIEFIQDTVHFRKDYTFRKSSTTILDKNYSIGLVKDFMIDEKNIGVFIKKTYKDGTTKTIYIKMHLDYAIMNYSGDFNELVETKPAYVDEWEYF